MPNRMDLEAFRKATPHGRASELAALPPAKAVELLRGLKAMDRPDSLLLLEEVQRNRVILLSEPHTQAAIMTAWSNSALLLSKKAATKALEKIVEADRAVQRAAATLCEGVFQKANPSQVREGRNLLS